MGNDRRVLMSTRCKLAGAGVVLFIVKAGTVKSFVFPEIFNFEK